MVSNSAKVQSAIIGFLRFTILVAILGAVWNGMWALIFSASVIFLFTFLPYFFEKKTRVSLPTEFEFVLIVFIYASLFLGEIHAYYTKFWWWDVVLHTSSGVILGFAGFLLLYVLYYQNEVKANPAWIAVFSFCFAVAVGSIWEIFEFSMDQIFGFNMQSSGLVDTMWDLIVDAVGAGAVSILAYFYIKKGKIPSSKEVLKKFTEKEKN